MSRTRKCKVRSLRKQKKKKERERKQAPPQIFLQRIFFLKRLQSRPLGFYWLTLDFMIHETAHEGKEYIRSESCRLSRPFPLQRHEQNKEINI